MVVLMEESGLSSSDCNVLTSHRFVDRCLFQYCSARHVWGWCRGSGSIGFAQGVLAPLPNPCIETDNFFSSLQTLRLVSDNTCRVRSRSNLPIVGKAWTADYGNPHDPHDFDFIYPISPLHNVPKDKTLPPLLLMTADRTYMRHKLPTMA